MEENIGPPGVLSVTQLLRSVRDVLERRFPLAWVGGELSNVSRAASGHLYFTLKDANAQVDCVMFRSRAAALDWELREGAKVEARALVTLYEPRGRFQLMVEQMRLAGMGELYERFLRLKEKLGREGLFDAAAKRPLPGFPRAIGVVTSLAIIAHEIPQEIGDFLVLLHSGFGRAKALALNVLSGLAATVGAVAAYFALSAVNTWIPEVLAVAAASMIYIAVADLIPGLHRRTALGESLAQVLFIALGIACIWGVHAALLPGA